MKSFFNNNKRAVSNLIFAGTAIVLIVAAAVGFGLYGTTASKTVTSTNTVTVATTDMMTTEAMTSESSMTQSSMSNTSNYAYQFNATSGAMISSAWLLDVPVGMHSYAVSVHAEGLEANGTYILEGQLANGTMATVPVSSQSMNMNTTSASEFQTDKNGAGTYWVVLDSCPSTTFESISLLYLPGMIMSNATTVATIHFHSTMMATTSSIMSH